MSHRNILAPLWLMLILVAPAGLAAVDGQSGSAAHPAKVQTDVVLAVYLPPVVHKSRYYWPAASYWVRPGAAIEDAALSMAQQVAPATFLVGTDEARPFGLLLALHPQLKLEHGEMTVTIKYKLIDGKGTAIAEGTRVQTAPPGDLRHSSGLREAASKALQSILTEIFSKEHLDAATYPATTTLAGVPVDSLIDHEKPVATGTAFYINPAGQLLTAAHVVEDCLKLEISKDEQVRTVAKLAESHLVDLAALDSGQPATHYLNLRTSGGVILGEPIVNVGYPLQPLLANSASLTRGNVSSLGALAGSLGQFQFSAPIQSGSSGGPVVSDQGELLGVAQSTLNLNQLAASGAASQNVNFALSPPYIAKFLRTSNVAYSSGVVTTTPDPQKSNDTANAATVQLSCYE